MGKLLTTITSLLLRLDKLALQALIFGVFFLITACSPKQSRMANWVSTMVEPIATQSVNQVPSATVQPTLPQNTIVTNQPTLTQFFTGTPTVTRTTFPTRTFTPTLTPEPLPVFTTKLIRPGTEPQAYITDTCAYLKMRWSPEGSPPGTVVIPVMFHGIRESGKPLHDNVTITEEQFNEFIAYAKHLGFETITTAQLVQFLEQNATIPSRSLLMIIDDRRPGTVESYFLPVLKENHWTLTLGWIIADTDEDLWTRMETMAATGLLDIQSHGYLHRYIVPDMPDEEVREEITASIPILEEHFGQRPLAFIWPGGNYTPFAVQVARQAGYRLGFTANSNGPLMFNWIPLREAERAINDPLMVLPRGWSTARGVNLDWAVQVGEKARQAAIESYPDEAEYFRRYCGGELPPLEDILPEE